MPLSLKSNESQQSYIQKCKTGCYLEKVATILDYQRFTYLDMTSTLKYFLCRSSCICCNYKLENYLETQN